MKEDAGVEMIAVKAIHEESGPCGGALGQKKRNYRRLRSKETNRIIHQQKEKASVQKVFDPTAWYVVQTKRYKEVESRDFLNSPKGFVNERTEQPYTVEAYAAIQEDEGSKVVIHGKIFVRVDKDNRIDILKKCLYLKGYVKDKALSRTENDFTDFARVPDREIKALRAILEMADGEVEYFEAPFRLNDAVKISKGILSKSEELKGMEGTVEMINGRNRVTVVLDKLGVFKFNLPASLLQKRK
ncbi:MAG: hypothetical protein IJ544_08825 [Prevotella sp.]|nr:hypothetical protein [Prevotella sp.]